ncbi:5-oxoprolinase subunit C family protein [Shumkonia mesophila]|uniref:5-oxoprolinase subunit C family protein n=1 Tax=Shumkonia mesophila TaxID=2838854 RepID=UPI002934F8FC|nr:biotin-dependent carboxyltransferase family protein [Shumkonia mesophila]
MAALLVVDPGPLATLQDLGRVGYQRFGVTVSGALDERALRLANRLAGNEAGEAAIEFTLAGGTYAVEAAACRIAVAGGDFPLSINGRRAGAYASHTLKRGDRLAIGRAQSGTRGYLAVAGGFDLPRVLGSRSTHVRSGLGGMDGQPLKAGSRLPLADAERFDGPDRWLKTSLWPKARDVVRVVLGPQDDLFTEEGKTTFLSSAYRILSQSDRMGYRFEGPPIRHAADYNIVSDGIAPGSVQVIGSGQPIIMLADRQTTGGYAKIATVISADLPVLAQCRPGNAVRFRAVGVEEAEDLRAAMLDGIERLAAAFYRAGSAADDTANLLGVNLIDGIVSPEEAPPR